MELADLFSGYPELENLDFQGIISNKKEFLDLRSEATEETPRERGEMYKHQKSIVRHLMFYDDLLVYNEPGTGKSCITPFLTEILKEVNPYRARKTYIIVKSSLIQEIMYQIICPCTIGQYEPAEGSKESQLRKSSKAKLKEWYKILSYDQFATMFNNEYYTLKKGKEPELDVQKINEDFDGCIFWVDEAHYFSMESIKMSECKYVEPDAKASEILSGDPEGEAGGYDDSGLSKKDKKRVYCALWNLFHVAKKIKRILTTGTPLINRPKEFGPLMNLILPRDKQFSEKLTDEDWNNMTLDQLAPYLNGRVSYIRAKESKAIPRYLGQKIQNSEGQEGQTIVYITLMSEFQEKVYVKNMNRSEETEGREGQDSENKGFGIRSRQIADFVYPDGSYGISGFGRYIKKSGKWFSIDAELLGYFQDTDNVAILSPKFSDIAKRITGKDPSEPDRKPDPGIFFCYSSFVRVTIIPLGLVLQTLGLERFEGADSAFKSRQEKKKTFCETGTAYENRTIILDKRPRFAVLTGNTDIKNKDNIMELLNSYENRHGEYLKVLLGSSVTGVGVNISNCLNVDIIDSEWNMSTVFQAESRAIRATSHDYLLNDVSKIQQQIGYRFYGPESHKHLLDDLREVKEKDLTVEEKNELQESGAEVINNLGGLKIFINIRRHCTVGTEDPIKGTSINIRMYQLAEDKDIPNRKLLRKVKQLAIDCKTHYKRNVRSTDTDGSAQCDYQQCAYKCYSDLKGTLTSTEDRETYDIFFLGPNIEIIKKEIFKIFKEKFSIDIFNLSQSIKKKIPDVTEKYIELAIYQVLLENPVFIDRFGFPMYLHEYSDIIFLNDQRDVGVREKEKYYSLGYIENVNILEITKMNFKDVIDFENMKDVPLKTRISLVETALIALRNNKYFDGPELTEPEKFILDYFNYFWSEFLEPEKEVEASLSKSQGKTKARKGVHRRYKTKELMEEVSKGNPVFVHKMNALEKIESGTKYNLTAQLASGDALLRILSLDDQEFRDVLDYELSVYDRLFQKEYRDKVNKFDIYGVVFKDEFRIIDHTLEKELKSENQRSTARGRVCDTYEIYLLVEILWKISKITSENQIPFKRGDIGNTRKNMIETLTRRVKYTKEEITAFDDLHLKFFYDALMDSSNYKDTYCRLIKEKLKEQERLIRIL